MTLLGTSACIISPVDPPIEEPELNLPPFIDIASVYPQPDKNGVVVSHYCTSGSSMQVIEEFGAARVLEYDVEQTLYVAWFMDYDASNPDIYRFPFGSQEIAGAPGGPIERSLSAVQIGTAWLQGDLAGLHSVELVVADADFALGGEQPNRTPREGGLSDSYPWVIDLVDDGECP